MNGSRARAECTAHPGVLLLVVGITCADLVTGFGVTAGVTDAGVVRRSKFWLLSSGGSGIEHLPTSAFSNTSVFKFNILKKKKRSSISPVENNQNLLPAFCLPL